MKRTMVWNQSCPLGERCVHLFQDILCLLLVRDAQRSFPRMKGILYKIKFSLPPIERAREMDEQKFATQSR